MGKERRSIAACERARQRGHSAGLVASALFPDASREPECFDQNTPQRKSDRRAAAASAMPAHRRELAFAAPIRLKFASQNAAQAVSEIRACLNCVRDCVMIGGRTSFHAESVKVRASSDRLEAPFRDPARMPSRRGRSRLLGSVTPGLSTGQGAKSPPIRQRPRARRLLELSRYGRRGSVCV